MVEFDQTQRKIVLSVDDYYRGKDKTEHESFVAGHPTTTGNQMASAMETAMGAEEVATDEGDATA